MWVINMFWETLTAAAAWQPCYLLVYISSSPWLPITLCSVIIPFQYTPQHHILPKNLKTSAVLPTLVSISTYLDPGVVSLIEVMYCLFYWSCVLSEHQCWVHSLACSFPLSKQTLDLCFEAFIKQKHPLWSLTGLAYSENKKHCWCSPDTHHPNYAHTDEDIHFYRS